MSRPSEYRCEEKVVTLLEQAKLSLNALRFVHATYHHLDNNPGWTPSHMSLKPTPTDDRICTVLAAELCAATATPGANDISMIHEGIGAQPVSAPTARWKEGPIPLFEAYGRGSAAPHEEQVRLSRLRPYRQDAESMAGVVLHSGRHGHPTGSSDLLHSSSMSGL